MKKLLRYFLYVFMAILAIIVVMIGYLTLALPNVGDPPDLKVDITPDKVERGKYLAYHVMMCADCHSVRDFSLFSGPPNPGTEFAGGEVFDQSMGFPGRFISPNITPAAIGDWTDGELFRLITTGVTKDGDPIFPVMPYHSYGKMAREDIEAVIAFLRTLDPIHTDHPKSKPDFPFNFIMRTMPQEASLREKPSTSDVAAYGEYVFTSAACGDCHTDFRNGKFNGPLAGGGRIFAMPDGSVLRTPNLTPHETGIGPLSRDEFILRFKRYVDSSYVVPSVHPGEFQTIMPWVMYSGMKEEDLSAIYDYLNTLEPYENDVERYTPPTQ